MYGLIKLGLFRKFTATLVLGLLFCGPELFGCGGTPRPPICGKTVVFAKAPPATSLLLTGGGTFSLPVVVFIAATPACVATPTSVTIDLGLDCTPDPDSAAVDTFTTIDGLGFGFNEFEVEITVPAGPPRVCAITGTASVLFSDGMNISASGDTQVCFVEPSIDDPGLPRLDLELLTPSISREHPGDQTEFTYTITNNDPNNRFIGEFEATMTNPGGIPAMTGPGGSGDGAFAISDPLGDHPPIMFEERLPEGFCVPLPPNPHLTQPGFIVQPIVLEPLEQKTITVLSRSWGLCGSGSCSESTVTVTGEYSDNSPGLACSGAVFAVDTSQVPDRECRGSGVAATFSVLDNNDATGRFVSVAADDFPIDLDIDMDTTGVNDSDMFDGFDFMDRLDEHTARGQLFVQGPFNAADPQNGLVRFQLSTDALLKARWKRLRQMVGAPGGLGGVGPVFTGRIGIDRAPFDGLDNELLLIELQTDFRSFLGVEFQNSQPMLGEIFTDGFESGNVMAWSRSDDTRGVIDGYQVYFDMRAYLVDQPPPFPCPQDLTADIDNDGYITRDDLRRFFGPWGSAPDFIRDRDNDGLLTIADMIVMVGKLECQEAGVIDLE